MSQQTEGGIKTFLAGEDLEAYRRVKLSAGDTVVYADAGEAFIGVTQEKVDSGKQVSVALRSAARSYKIAAKEALAANAALYGGDDGKVQDTASGNAIGTSLEAATADGDIIECLLDDGNGALISGAATAIVADSGNGAIPIVFAKQGITDANAADVDIVAVAPFKFRIINWWIISRDTTAANIKIKNGTTDASAVKAKGTTNDAIVLGGDVIAAQKDVAAAGALKVNASAAAAFDIFVLAIKVA